jgi:hypothetical protein
MIKLIIQHTHINLTILVNITPWEDDLTRMQIMCIDIL